MAAWRRLFGIYRSSRPNIRYFSRGRTPTRGFSIGLAVGATVGGVIAWRLWRGRVNFSVIPVLHAREVQSEDDEKPRQLTFRELRFRHFASVEHDGVIYMTPQDFLESLTEEMPRPRIGRAKHSQREIDSMLKRTPNRTRGDKNLFRSLHDLGIISYTEYLFLLCVLTKPHSGFRIAFNMFDTDGNQIVDKKEFLVLESFFALPPNERKFVPRSKNKLEELLSLERIFSHQPESTDSDDSTEHKLDPVQDTTLLIHFFGTKGTDVLKYQDFHRFMENLQSEVIELEFLEFSKGMPTISEESFARILLRYTLLDTSEIEECIGRVKERIPTEKGITFQEFKQFCQFLNNLDDFNIAMKMYTFAEQSVSQEEFQRAVKVCTGFTLGTHIVNTVFQIFDADGDGHLSHKEFISIMKDRLHRGARAQMKHTQGNWDAFRACVKNEMKAY